MKKIRSKELVKELFIKPAGTWVKRVRIYYYDDKNDEQDGSLRGIEMYDAEGTCLLMTPKSRVLEPKFKIKEILLETGERLVGVQSGMRKQGYALHWDL